MARRTPRRRPRADAVSASAWYSRGIGLQLLLLVFAVAGHRSTWRAIDLPEPPVPADAIPITESAGNFPPAEPQASPAESTSASDQSAAAGEAAADPLASLPEPMVAVAVPASHPPLVPDALLEALLPPLPPAPAPAPASGPVARKEAVASRTASPAPRRTSGTSGGVRTSSHQGTGPGQATAFSGAGTGRFPLPPYPAEARRRGLEGKVLLRVEVSGDGVPALPNIESGSGHPSLDRAAVEWIKRRWRWEAGSPRLFRIPIDFQLR